MMGSRTRPGLAAIAVIAAGPAAACSLLVDTGGLDTQTDAPDGGDASTTDGPRPTDGAPDQTADAGDAASADAGPCPSGKGPSMVHLSFGYTFCIDSTEVTVGQYKEFLLAITGGYVPPNHPRCGWNASYVMAAQPFCQMPDSFPASCVNWCQAYAFCAWAGKHLCGLQLGGSAPFNAALDPTVSAWPSACTSGGNNVYNFGNTYMPYCNMPDPNNDGGGPNPVAVASDTQCEGPSGVFDLLGNASEWVDSCDFGDASTGNDDNCHHIGGASSSYKECLIDDTDTRDFGYYDGYPIGFRCCSP